MNKLVVDQVPPPGLPPPILPAASKPSPHPNPKTPSNINITIMPLIPPQRLMRLHQRRRHGRQPLQINHHLVRIRDARLPLARLHLPHAMRPMVHGNHHAVHGHGIQALVGVLHLPHPPEPVQRRVVEVEDGVARGGGGVPAGIDGVDVVAGGVDLGVSVALFLSGV